MESPLKHPVNIAYEAATADIRDFNLIDSFHLEYYNEKAVNYNRDVQAFPVLRRVIEEITGEHSFYKSPTDMGVNRAGFGIINDDAVREAAVQEIIRRCFRYACEYAIGFADKETVQRVELLLEDLDAKPEDRIVVKHARQAALEADWILLEVAVRIRCGTLALSRWRLSTGTGSPSERRSRR